MREHHYLQNTVHKFGKRSDIDAADGLVDIWEGPTDTYNWLASAATLYLASSSASDTEDILVTGLDSAWEAYSETVTLSGQTPVATSATFARVFRMYPTGSTDLVGDVTAASESNHTSGVPDDDSKVHAVVKIGDGQTLMALYTIPAGKRGLLYQWGFSINRGTTTGVKYADVVLYARSSGGVFRTQAHLGGSNQGGTPFTDPYPIPVEYTAQTDLTIRADTDSNNTEVAGKFCLVILDARA